MSPAVSAHNAKDCDGLALGFTKPRGCLQPDNCAQQFDMTALSEKFIKCLYLKVTAILLISLRAEIITVRSSFTL